MSAVLPLPVARPHWPGLALGLAGVALVAARLPAGMAPVFAVALALGLAFVLLDYGFAGGFRAFLQSGDGRALGASFIAPAVAALVVLPVGLLAEGFGRFVAPLGLPLLVGAAIFGVGMQLANGCGSGTLVAAGQGSRRMWVALPFFCLGGVLGSLLVPAAMRLPDLGVVDLGALLGPWGGLAATLAMLLAGALLVLRGARPRAAELRAGAIIGGLAGLMFLASGLPWGITTGLTLWGAKAAMMMGADMPAAPFWAEGWARAALDGSLLALDSSLADIGLLLGALLAAAAQGRLRHRQPVSLRGAAGAALGGVLMGVGARLAYGCNVGAFLGGGASGSLHGVIWVAAALPGSWLGIRLRPVFGLN
ncbi:YeeE/YedE thiosulfate transporter family protein [Falsiroseomonas tokyonensis]|uniref:YeeE/YedE thiosulfate transporter family protein n=1 Tax=Falsiroseomonas tokyonensis TaxID=430521 RepID=A0ABV7BL60_9PROT|nr:YeeE/YedE thiosulfate transporter family protein [Falsiroseomonas tokyonensis]MBU8536304.1 YeeE/YedE family protein [Falsiroseomonas tokyonensis]